MRKRTQSHPELVASYGEYNIMSYRRTFYGVPQLAGPVDLKLAEERRHMGVLHGKSIEQLQQQIDAAVDAGAVPVEFAGWLPVFELSGNCGRHPQFKHTNLPPTGYRFSCSAPLRNLRRSIWQRAIAHVVTWLNQIVLACCLALRPLFGIFRGTPGVTIRNRVRVLAHGVRMFAEFLRHGAKIIPALRFLRTRNFQSQLLVTRHQGLVFLPSMPYTYGQNPWVVEIEDPTTLFYPHVHNGVTYRAALTDSPYFPIVKTLLESDQCKGVITHMKSTADMVGTLFGSETIRAKIFHTPLGVKLPERWQRHEEDDDSGTINLLFTNSWHQMAGNFFLRGGLDVLDAFSVLHERYPQLRLTLRTNLPGLEVRYHRIIEEGWVRVVNRVLSAREMEELLAQSHIYLLPAARVHIVSLLQAMSHGLAVVTSDGWGFNEYVTHQHNGLMVKGRYDKVSWADNEVGMLREDYRTMYKSNPKVIRGLIRAVSRLVEDPTLRRRLGRTARRDVETTYNLERWNAGLREVFDRSLGVTSGLVGERLENGDAAIFETRVV
jgi:glycosyltransferase involved in cell wall biosynthesis